MNKTRQAILIFGDILTAYLSLLPTLFFGFFGKFEPLVFWKHLYPFSLLYLCWLIIFYIFDLYNLNISKDKMLFYPRLIEALAICLITGVAFFYLLPAFGITPKSNLLLAIGFFGLFAFLWHKIFYRLFSRYLKIQTAFFGFNNQAEKLAGEITARPYLGYEIKAVFSDKNIKSKFLKNIKILPGKKDFFENLKKQKIDILIVAETPKGGAPLSRNVYDGLRSKTTFLTLTEAYELVCKKIPSLSLKYDWFLSNIKSNRQWFNDKIKIVFDYLSAGGLLVLTLPLWVIIAFFIKMEDKGKIFYKQKRVGKNNKEFSLIKFRTMTENAEENGPKFAKKQDPRTTKAGKFLRRTHLDELPQLVNVLKNDISLVGPRPERLIFVKTLEKQIPHYNLRHLIKPGITGWDQIKFKYARTLADNKEKLYYDLYYLKNRNIFLDTAILLKTFQSFFRNTD